MNMSVRFAISSLAAIVFVLMAASSLFAAEVEGRVVGKYSGFFLLDTADGMDVVVLTGDTVLKNIESVRRIPTGRVLKVEYEKETGGAKYAVSAEIPPEADVPASPDGLQTVEELAAFIRDGGDYVLVDTRAAGRYESGHIPTAVHLPAEAPPYDKQWKARTVIFYSGDSRDPSAYEAYQAALEAGFGRVKLFPGGMYEWLRAGQYIEAGAGFLRRQLEEKRAVAVVDIRQKGSVPDGFIPGAFHLPLEELGYGRIVPVLDLGGSYMDLYSYQARPTLVIYGDDAADARARQAARKIAAWPSNAMVGARVIVLVGGLDAWRDAGYPLLPDPLGSTVSYDLMDFPDTVSFQEFRAIWDARERGKEKGKILLDLTDNEIDRPMYMDEFTFVKNIPLDQLPQRISELPRNKEIVLFCTTGKRSKIAYHLLKKVGYQARYLARKLRIRSDGTFN